MPDPINTTASAVTILDRMLAALSWLRHRFKRKPQPLFSSYSYDERHDFELRPISVRIDLLNPVPYIELKYYAINYLKRQLTLITPDTQVTGLDCGTHIDQIPLYQEYALSPRSSSLVIFRRKLLDSEARVLLQIQLQNPLSASFSLTAKAKYCRKEYVYGPVASKTIDGWVHKMTPPEVKK